MLSFVFTDANVPPEVLQALLERGAERSFNATTVDGDTSTSDTLLLFATGAAGNASVTDWKDRRLKAFAAALDEVLIDLAQQVVRDGEGASKFITIDVSEAASARAAKRIALAIANSPLVKTAIAGEDANWGRIVMVLAEIVSVAGIVSADEEKGTESARTMPARLTGLVLHEGLAMGTAVLHAPAQGRSRRAQRYFGGARRDRR